MKTMKKTRFQFDTSALPAEYQKLAHDVIAPAVRGIEKGKEWCGMVIALARKAQEGFDVLHVAAPGLNDEAKPILMQQIAEAMEADQDIEVVFQLCEAWSVKHGPDNPPDVPPSLHPDREEVFMASILTRDNQRWSALAKVVRHGKKKRVLSEITSWVEQQYTGSRAEIPPIQPAAAPAAAVIH